MSKTILFVLFFYQCLSTALAGDCKEIKNMPECHQAKCRYDFFAQKCLDVLSQESSTACQEFNDSVSCKQNLSCYWKTTGMRDACHSYLDFDCIQYTESQTCSQVPQCQWHSTSQKGACSNLGCIQFQDSSTCGYNQQRCKWFEDVINAACLSLEEYANISCQDFNDSAPCKQNPSCFWKSTGMRGVCDSYLDFDCTQFNESQDCSSVPQCYWHSTDMRGACSNLGCKQFTDNQNCGFNQECKWFDSGMRGTCLSLEEYSKITCYDYSDSLPCKQNQSCYWTTTGMRGACHSYLDLDCTQSNESLLCQSIPQCFWRYGMSGGCSNRGCQQFTDAQTCAFNQKCKWSSTDKIGSCVSNQQEMY
ncbi:hypothetical protein ABPG72_017602 [Tetrahymena utriculariae]